MSKLHVHEMFINDSPRLYKGIIANYDLNNGNELGIIIDKELDKYWIYETNGKPSETEYRGESKAYNKAIELLIKVGEEINAKLVA